MSTFFRYMMMAASLLALSSASPFPRDSAENNISRLQRREPSPLYQQTVDLISEGLREARASVEAFASLPKPINIDPDLGYPSPEKINPPPLSSAPKESFYSKKYYTPVKQLVLSSYDPKAYTTAFYLIDIPEGRKFPTQTEILQIRVTPFIQNESGKPVLGAITTVLDLALTSFHELKVEGWISNVSLFKIKVENLVATYADPLRDQVLAAFKVLDSFHTLPAPPQVVEDPRSWADRFHRGPNTQGSGQ
ncbi:MAG: hypothetical protein M1829_001533 [Trizodia sp. TS-e1964]|nr:MAG: hypothetical protein M1829_001533 [Trizodia sp. TS-e1964]